MMKAVWKSETSNLWNKLKFWVRSIHIIKCLTPQSGIAVTFGKGNRIKHTPQRSHPKYLSSNQNPTLPILHQEVKATNVACGNGVQQIFKGCCTFDPSKMVTYSHIHEKSVEVLLLPTNGLRGVSKLKHKYPITFLHIFVALFVYLMALSPYYAI